MTLRLCMLATLAAACRPDPGAPVYPEPDAISFGGEDSDMLEGPDPYVEGEARFSYSVFYEGGFSDQVLIDDTSAFYYVYSDTYTESTDIQDRVEGRSSTVLEMTGAGWFGGGVHWDGGEDISDWTTMFVSFRSSDEGLDDFEIRMVGGAEAGVFVGDYGWQADGSWQHLEIPLADLEDAGVDLTAVTVGFMLIGEGQADGEKLKIDNLYLTQD